MPLKPPLQQTEKLHKEEEDRKPQHRQRARGRTPSLTSRGDSCEGKARKMDTKICMNIMAVSLQGHPRGGRWRLLLMNILTCPKRKFCTEFKGDRSELVSADGRWHSRLVSLRARLYSHGCCYTCSRNFSTHETSPRPIILQHFTGLPRLVRSVFARKFPIIGEKLALINSEIGALTRDLLDLVVWWLEYDESENKFVLPTDIPTKTYTETHICTHKYMHTTTRLRACPHARTHTLVCERAEKPMLGHDILKNAICLMNEANFMWKVLCERTRECLFMIILVVYDLYRGVCCSFVKICIYVYGRVCVHVQACVSVYVCVC